MSQTPPGAAPGLEAEILRLLDENRVMTVATLRPDGWPQATLVGFANDGLTLYFAVARISQKLANIQRDPRISIALGQRGERLRGLSMAAHAAEVTDPAERRHLASLMKRRYPHQDRFSPRETSFALLRATPTYISIIDLAEGPGEPELARVQADGASVDLIAAAGGRAARLDGGGAPVHVRRVVADVYRPGAPF